MNRKLRPPGIRGTLVHPRPGVNSRVTAYDRCPDRPDARTSTVTSALESAPDATVATLDAGALLALSPAALDAVFRAAPPGEIPRGDAAGTILSVAGARVGAPLSRALGAVVWRGKAFRPATRDLLNRLGPTGIPGVRAEVRAGESRLDGRPCIVLDYSRTSRLAGWVRDEIREVAPGVYLGIAWGAGRVFLRFALTLEETA
jgi:hypothetical protein